MDLVQAKNSFIISERVLSRLRYLLFSWSLCCSLVLQVRQGALSFVYDRSKYQTPVLRLNKQWVYR